MRKKLKFDVINMKVSELFFTMMNDSKTATMLVMRSLESLLMKVVVSYIKFVGEDNVAQDNLKQLEALSTNNSLKKYFNFLEEVDSSDGWSRDLASVLVLLEKRLRT